ncbi:MAG: glycosyltransferase 87 family protein [Lachnospiraceae bacterium]|nr:glycosyltransferase 87 family protein [Lachnospiraceae bacterium]
MNKIIQKMPATGKGEGRRLKPLTLLFGIVLINTLLFLFLLPKLGQHGFDWIVMENNSDFESADYFLVMLFSLGKEKVYEFGVDACYSPLSYVFFYLISKATAADQLLAGVDLFSLPYEELIRMTPKLLSSPYHLLGFLMYTLGGIGLFLYAVSRLNLPKTRERLLCFTVLTSVPLLFGAVERGNLTMYVAALTLIAFLLKDAESKWAREAALLLIAIAAGLKFYPAFMGLLYLREKRFKEAGRLIVYGILAVFLPFAFCGGMEGLGTMLSNLSILAMGNAYVCRLQFLQGVLGTMGIYGGLNKLLNTCFILVLLIFILITGNTTRRMVFLAAALAMYPPNAYRYTLLFFLIPLFSWIREEAEVCSAMNFLKAVLYACIFSIPTIWGIATGFTLTFGYYTMTYVEFFIYLAAWCLLGVSVLEELSAVVTWVRTRRKGEMCSED